MVSSANENEMWLVMMDALVGERADLEPAKTAFETTRGDFGTRFTAAVEALFARLVRPEVFIDLPEHPEELTKSALDGLVRPAAVGFLRSHPSKDELLEQVERIRRRQERRPVWIPRIDRNGAALPAAAESDGAQDQVALHPLVITGFPELGEVTISLPSYEDRPELKMASGGVGELEAVMQAVLGIADEKGPCGEVRLNAQANEALVPEEVRWWSSRPAEPDSPQLVSAAQDPGVASELLATSPTLGDLAIVDSTAAGVDAVVTALASTGDWRHSRSWLLDGWEPGEGTGVLSVARAAIAGWADEDGSGLIVYVYGGAFHGRDGLIPDPTPLHSYLLCVTRSATGADTVETVHRLILSCPGENWCHRSGCVETPFLEAAALLLPVITAGDAAAAATNGDDWACDAYRYLYGVRDADEYCDSVLDLVEAILSHAGWVELDRSVWEGGLEESLLRRGQHCLTAAYDPVTRQIRLVDGKAELESMLQLLAEDGVLIGDDGREIVGRSEDTEQRWGSDLLAAAQDVLRGNIIELPQTVVPVQSALLGLHSQADGGLRGPTSTTLVAGQLTVLLRRIGVLRESD